MPTSTQQTNVSAAISAIRSAQNLLSLEINSETETVTLIKLSNQYHSLDSNLSLLLHAQNITDDMIFSAAAATLKSQTSGLKADEAAIKGIISDIGTATKVVGYIEQALGFIAKL